MDTVSGGKNAHEQKFSRFHGEIVSESLDVLLTHIYFQHTSLIHLLSNQTKKRCNALRKIDESLLELPDSIPEDKKKIIRDYCAELNRIEDDSTGVSFMLPLIFFVGLTVVWQYRTVILSHFSPREAKQRTNNDFVRSVRLNRFRRSQ